MDKDMGEKSKLAFFLALSIRLNLSILEKDDLVNCLLLPC